MIENSYYHSIKHYQKEKAREFKYEVVDLDEWFIKDSEKNNSNFEFIDNGHWNKRAHKIPFNGLSSSTLFSNFVEDKKLYNQITYTK